MKLSKLSLPLIPISFVLLLSIAGESAETKSPAERPQQSKPTDSKTTDSKSTAPSSPFVTVNNPPAPIEAKSPQKDPDPWPPLWTIVVGLIITAGGAVVAICTLNNIRQQVVIAEQALRTSERAWLSVTFDKPFVPKGGGSPIFYSVKNTGKSVAFLKERSLKPKPWPNGIIPKRTLDPKPIGEFATLMVVFPNDTVEMEGIIDVSGESFNHKIFDVYGYVAYDDIFKNRHITRFCYAFNKDTGKFEYVRNPQSGYSDAD